MSQFYTYSVPAANGEEKSMGNWLWLYTTI